MKKAVIAAVAATLLITAANAGDVLEELDPYIREHECDSLPSGRNSPAEQCKSDIAWFKRDYPTALKGDYQAMRNIGAFFTLGAYYEPSTKRFYGIVINKPLGCAWRAALLASGDTQVNDLDQSGFKNLCLDTLNRQQLVQAEGQYRALMQRIFKLDASRASSPFTPLTQPGAVAIPARKRL